jgi:hypothetical protein
MVSALLPPGLTYFDTQKLHPRDQLQKQSFSPNKSVDKQSGAAKCNLGSGSPQRHAKRTYLVHARTKPQRLKKININPFVLLPYAADQNSNRGFVIKTKVGHLLYTLSITMHVRYI